MSGLYFDPLSPGRLRQLRDEARGWADKLDAHAQGAEVFLADVLGAAAGEGRRLADDAEAQLEGFEGVELDLDHARQEAARLRGEADYAAAQVERLKDPTTPEPSTKAMLAARDAAFVASLLAARGDEALARAERARATTLREAELMRYTKALEKGRTRAVALALRPNDAMAAGGEPLALAGFAVSRSEAKDKALVEALAVWRHDGRASVREVLLATEPPALAQRQSLTGIDDQWHGLRLAERMLDRHVRECFAALVRVRGDAEVKKLIERLETPAPLGAEVRS